MKHLRSILLFSILIFSVSKSSTAIDLDSLLWQSVGGENARVSVEQFRSLYMSGDFDMNGQTAKYEMQFLWPNKLRMYLNFGSFSFTQILNDTLAFGRNHNNQTSPLSGFEKRELINQCYMISLAYLKPGGLPGEVTYLDQRDFRGNTYHAVAFIPSVEDTIVALIDTASGLIKYQLSRQDNLRIVTELKDYQEIGGMLIPLSSGAVSPNMPLSIKMTTDSIAFNPTLNETLFSLPQADSIDFSFPEADSVVIPINYVRGHVHVEGKINGQRFWFILDSGASTNMFDKGALADFEFEKIGEFPSVGIGGMETAEMVRVDSVEIGELILHNQVAGLMQLAQMPYNPGYRIPFGGILGYDFLSRFPIRLDYLFGSMTVYNPDSFVLPATGVRIPFELTFNVPTVTASVMGQEGKFLIDLGNALGFIVHPGFAARTNLLDSLIDFDTLGGSFAGVGGMVGGEAAIAKTATIGSVTLADQKILLPESTEGLIGSQELAGNIGNPVLCFYYLTLDYRSGTLILDPYLKE